MPRLRSVQPFRYFSRHALASLTLCSAALLAPRAGTGFASGYDTILLPDLEKHLEALASPELEGRDTPSLGLEQAARYLAERFREAGLAFAPDSGIVWKDIAQEPLPGSAGANPDGSLGAGAEASGTYQRPFTRNLPQADKSGSSLALLIKGQARLDLRYGFDFVPVAGCNGDANGDLVFAGFGIDSKSEHYNDLEGLKLKDRIVLIVEGEPRHPKAFEGPEITRAASLWEKIDTLAEAGALGVLAVRRPPEAGKDAQGKKAAPSEKDPALEQLSFRTTWAVWNGAPTDARPRHALPVLEVSLSCGEKLLGEDVASLAAKMDKTAHPLHVKASGRKVSFQSKTREANVRIDNVVGLVPGSDLADEYVVVGAHYDHIGVDDRGRIGCGADDNASGSAGLVEIAQALAVAGPRRSVFICSFAGEEDGLLGSNAFCARLPVPKEKIVAMVNLDMIGRGDPTEVAVLGVVQNPGFERLLNRGKAQKSTGVQKIVMRQGEDLFERGDHFSFHKLGIPVLFFFEGLPLEKNKDYHTWRDTLDLLDYDKMLRTTRLAYNTTWLIANDDERPPRPHD